MVERASWCARCFNTVTDLHRCVRLIGVCAGSFAVGMIAGWTLAARATPKEDDRVIDTDAQADVAEVPDSSAS